MKVISGYRLILASAVGERDGMALELDSDDGEQIAEVFEEEETRIRTFSLFVEHSVPVEAIEWLIDEARRRL